jgi:hypothetical protein
MYLIDESNYQNVTLEMLEVLISLTNLLMSVIFFMKRRYLVEITYEEK